MTDLNSLKIIKRSGVRILRPCEARALINAIPKNEYKIMFKGLLVSGLRYIECRRFQEKGPARRCHID